MFFSFCGLLFMIFLFIIVCFVCYFACFSLTMLKHKAFCVNFLNKNKISMLNAIWVFENQTKQQ